MSSPPAPSEPCPYCRAAGVGGYPGCQERMHALTALALGNGLYFGMHRAAFDCYCMQHAEIYCISAKSYAAHLGGLCCQVEHGGDPAIYAAIQKWLNGRLPLEKPGLLGERGALTVCDLLPPAPPDEHRRRVLAWAQEVWRAYTPQHEIARGYLRTALGLARR
jgi:hypothetical protein